MEGTQARARASTHGHSFSADPFGLRGFRCRGDPRLPLVPSPTFDGKEGVDGSSPSEGLKYLQIQALCCPFRRRPGGEMEGVS